MDASNGAFEIVGSFFIWLSVYSLWKDRHYAGVHFGLMVFYAGWSVWDLFFYWHLGQMFSFYAGFNSMMASVLWVILAAYYGKTPQEGKVYVDS